MRRFSSIIYYGIGYSSHGDSAGNSSDDSSNKSDGGDDGNNDADNNSGDESETSNSGGRNEPLPKREHSRIR